MTMRTAFLIKGLAALLVLWLVVFAISSWVKSAKPTAEKVAAYATENPLSEIEDSEKRKEVIGNLAAMLNQMEASELRALESEEFRDPRRKLFEEMSGDEQLYFLQRRIGRAFEQIMQSFNEMERDERKKIVERSLKRLKEGDGGPGGERLEEADPELVEQITEAGLNAYYSEASAETKIDLAPLLEEMQRSMTRMGGRP